MASAAGGFGAVPIASVVAPVALPPLPNPACGLRMIVHVTCDFCGASVADWDWDAHVTAHRAAARQSHDEQVARACHVLLSTVDDRSATATGTGTGGAVLLPALSALVAEYARLTDDSDVAAPKGRFDFDPHRRVGGLNDVDDNDSRDTKVQPKRWTEFQVCLKVSDAQLLAGMRVSLRFQSALQTRAEFADPQYLLRCRDVYLRFLALQSKLNAQAKAKANANANTTADAKASASASASDDDAPVLVPNEAVDVWWQSHLIRPHAYARFCAHRFGALVDRASLQRTDPLSSDRKRTEQLWAAEYGEPYANPPVGPAPRAAGAAGAAAATDGGLTGEQQKEQSALEQHGLVSVNALIADRQWVPNFRAYRNAVAGPVPPRLQCPKGHDLSLYRGAAELPPGYSAAGSFNCDTCKRRDRAYTHWYHCDDCRDYDVCRDCVRAALTCYNGHNPTYPQTAAGPAGGPRKPAHASFAAADTFKCTRCEVQRPDGYTTARNGFASDYAHCAVCAPSWIVCERCVESVSGDFAWRCLREYKKFWLFVYAYPQSCQHFAPPYGVDWVWHSAQLHPALYAADCHALMGGLLDHTPWPAKSAADVQAADTRMRELWRQTFGSTIC